MTYVWFSICVLAFVIDSLLIVCFIINYFIKYGGNSL